MTPPFLRASQGRRPGVSPRPGGILLERGLIFVDIFSAADISADGHAVDGDFAGGISSPSGALHGVGEALGVE